MEVFGAPSTAGRRLFEAEPAQEKEDEDDEALLWMSHPTGNGGGRREPPPGFTPSPSPSPTPSPEPSPSPTPEPSRPCARDDATCTEGYADADDAQDACGKQPRFCWIEPHTTTSPNEDTYRACTCPEERPPDAETVQGEADADPDAWWNNLERSRREGELYARRVLPGAAGRSAAASVAVAITLAHPGKSVLAGQAATLDAACDALGGCDQGDWWTSVHDRDDADVNEDTPDPQHLSIDDAGWALTILSRAIEPAVHAVIEGMLICLAPTLCTSHCDVCNEWVGLGNTTAEEVVRRVELALHVAPKQASRSVLDCVASFECLRDIATEVALAFGAEGALPPTARLVTVTKANIELLEGARAEAKQNASWQVRRPARFGLLREHIDQVRAHEQTPLGEDDEVVQSGRRLAERPPPSPPPLTEMQQAMKERTNETCRQLAIKNATGAHASHVQATHFWMLLEGGGNDRKGQGRVCVDCDFPNYTTSCRQHMAHVGRALIKMRLDAEKPREIPYAEKKRRMTEKVRDHMDEMCCAELPNGKEECAAKYCIIHVRRTMTQRATHIARKMTEANHPKAEEHFDVATQVGIDVVNPDLHPDPACRVTNHTTDLAKMECMGKSIMHHAAKQHGYDAETLQSKLDELNLNVGESLMAMAKTFGYAREGRGPVKSAFFERQAKDEATASTLMRESRKRMEAKQGRKLAEEARDEGFGGGHGLGQHALHAGALRRQLQNASGVMHRGMMAIDRAATRSNNVQSRGAAGNRARPPHPDDLDWHAAKSSVPNPLMTILAVSAEEGSVASRFGNGIVKLNALRDRVTGAMDTHRRRLERRDEQRGRRRMSETQVRHADSLYEALEVEHLQNEHKRPQLPKEHALSWLHELVDWPSAVDEGSRLLGIVRERHKMREGGAAHHDIVKKHPTGWSWLDDAAKSHPTILGDAVRRVLYRKETGADPPWHHASLRHRVSRRLEDNDAARLAHDAEAPPPRFGGLRRLGVAFMESTVAAPFAFYDTMLPSGAEVKGSEITFWEATLRYIVAGTVGCYFVAPANEPSKTQGEGGTEDGDALRIMRPSEEKLCFPALPFAMPNMQPFRKMTGTEGVDIYALNYMDYCAGHGSAMQLVYDYLVSWGIDPRDENPLLPNAPLLRSAEAVDAVLNAATSGSPDVENEMNAGRILCSIVQLGGIIYVTMLIIVSLLLIQLLPVANAFAQILFDGCNVARSACVAAIAAKEVAGGLNLEKEGGDLTDIVKSGGGDAQATANTAKSAVSSKLKKSIPSMGMTGSSANGQHGVDDEYLSPQQMRSIMRKRRGLDDTKASTISSTVQRVASFGRRAMRLGTDEPERSGLLHGHSNNHGSSGSGCGGSFAV